MAEFKVNNKTYELVTDPDLDEMCAAEEAFDKDFGSTRMTTSKMLIWISMRRGGDEVDPADIGALPLSTFSEAEGDVSPPAPRLVKPTASSGGPSEPNTDTTEDQNGSGSQSSEPGSGSARETFFTSLRAS